MFTASIQTGRSADWIKAHLSQLAAGHGQSLEAISRRAPYGLHRAGKSLLTSACTALVFTDHRGAEGTRLQLVFVPNFFALVSLLCWLVAIAYSWSSYRTALAAHRIDESYAAPSPPWALFLSGLVLLAIIVFGSVRSEGRFLVEALRRTFSDPA